MGRTAAVGPRRGGGRELQGVVGVVVPPVVGHAAAGGAKDAGGGRGCPQGEPAARCGEEGRRYNERCKTFVCAWARFVQACFWARTLVRMVGWLGPFCRVMGSSESRQWFAVPLVSSCACWSSNAFPPTSRRPPRPVLAPAIAGSRRSCPRP